MISNYLKIFFRLFLKQTAFTLINILGLAVGLACCLIIALFVRNELSFDRFFSNAGSLYRVNQVTTTAMGEVRELANTYFPVAPLLADNFPQISDIARWDPHVSAIIVGDSIFYENEFKMVDPEFFRLFDVNWLEGDPASAFSGATDLVVTRSFAEKYFGGEPALGQRVQMVQEPRPLLRVTGVIEDLPVNTHLSGAAFAPMSLRNLLGVEPGGEWSESGYYTYAQLRPGVDIARFQQELDAFAQASIPPQPSGARIALRLQPITGIHLNYTLGDWPGKPSGNKVTISIFSAIGLGILLLACFNFVNLSTARSTQRFKEVGLRLTLGARRTQLLAQFLGESVLFVLLAITLALVSVELTLPGIQALFGLDLAFDDLSHPMVLAGLLGAGLLLGLLAGWYPAVLMSGYKPAAAMKDPSRSQVRALALKNVLVVLQFAVAIGMVIAAGVVFLQMRYTQILDLGYTSDQIVLLVTDDRAGSHGRRELLKERLLQSAGITAVALSVSNPAQGAPSTTVVAEGSEVQHRMAYFETEIDFFALYEIALLTGRLPDADLASDRVRPATGGEDGIRGSVVLNVTGAREFGWSAEEAPGKRLSRNGAWYEVIGVVQDTISSAYSPAQPTLYAVPESTEGLSRMAVKLEGSTAAGGLALIERVWQDVNPDEAITSIFVSDLIGMYYQGASKLWSLAFMFAGIAICISCMGLFGLAHLSAQYRTKEIGVRKVMGGSVWSIVLLLTNDFSKLVLVSNVIAWPVAYVAMNRWLEQFAYRIDLTLLVFIGSGLIALCIAWVTVGGTAAKAASRKPVLALRYE